MYTVKSQSVVSVAMETVSFHIDQMSFFLRPFVSHLVGLSEKFGSHEKSSLSGAGGWVG